MQGCKVSVPTIHGARELNLDPMNDKSKEQRIQGNGIQFVVDNDAQVVGDHISSIYTQIPRDIDDNMRSLASQLFALEAKTVCSAQNGETSRLKFQE